MIRPGLFASVACLPLAASLLGAVPLARASVGARWDRLLASETNVAAQLLMETRSDAEMNGAFPGRWQTSDDVDPLLDQAVVEGAVGSASLYDEDSWFQRGTLFLTESLHVPLAMAVALMLALALEQIGRASVALRTLLFLPGITSLVAIAIAWQWMLHDEYGLINWLLSFIGLGPVPWLSSTTIALPALMILSIWIVLGYQIVLFPAGLAAIPRELYDAARIDGAGSWQRFRHVTLPGLRPTLFFVLVTAVIGSFQMFGVVYVMTEGGPLHSTDVAVFHIYEEAWEFFRFGRAAAMSWLLFTLIFVATWIQFRILERRLEESA